MKHESNQSLCAGAVPFPEQSRRGAPQISEEQQERKLTTDATGSGNRSQHDPIRKHRLLQALQVSGVATMTWCQTDRRLDLSYEACELLGIPRQTSVRTFRTLLRRVDPADRNRVLVWIWDNLIASRNVESNFEIEFRIMAISASSKTRWIKLVGQYEPGAHPDRLALMNLADISQSRTLEEQQRALRARDERRVLDLERLNRNLEGASHAAKKALQAQNRLISFLSRDIRTPLNDLLGMLSLLEESKLDSLAKERLQIAAESGRYIHLMFDHLVDMAHNQIDGLAVRSATFELSKLFGESCLPWADIARHKGLNIQYEVGPECPQWIEVDGERLRQILDLFLKEITAGWSFQSMQVRVRMAGTKILRFEARTDCGVRTAQTADLDGNEMSVPRAMRAQIVEALGGRMGETLEPRHELYWIELPCVAAFSPPRSETEASEFSLPSGRPTRVLVAEDVLTNQIVAEGHLHQLGCECVCVADGEEALKAVAADEFDVVLMDMAMPVMDGPTALRAIRSLPGHKGKIPVIALTAYSRPEEVEPMLAAGANDVVIKPILASELQKALASVLAD